MSQPAAAADVLASQGVSFRRAVILCSAGGFLDGYDLLIMGAALLQIVPAFALSPAQTGWLTSIPFLAMVFGALTAGHLCDRFGRRTVFMVDVIMFMVCAIVQAITVTFWQLFAVRFLIGFAIGMDMPTGSSMLAEYAPADKRGGITTLINTAWLFGGFTAALVGFGLYHLIGDGAWRWMFALGAVPALVVAVMRHNLPETPYWQRELAARRERRPAGGQPGAQLGAKSGEANGFAVILRSRFRGVVAFFTLYMVVQACVGGPAFVYTALIFKQVISFSGSQALLLNAVLLLAYTVISLSLQFTALEKYGRKPFAMGAAALTACGALATAFLAGSGLALVVAFFAFAVGVQMMTIPFWPWSVEQLPTRIRATGQSIGSAGAKLGQFVGVLIFTPTMLASIGWTSYFIGVAIVFFLMLVAVKIFGPETKGTALLD